MNKKQKCLIAAVPVLIMTLSSFFILLNSIDTGEIWRISAAGTAFLIFGTGTVLTLRQLKKESNRYSPE